MNRHDAASALRRCASRAALVLAALVLAGCSSPAGAPAAGTAEDPVVLRLGHGLNTTHPVHRAMAFMGERLDSLSGGTMRLLIYPSQQLGTEREALELLQIGSLAMTKVSGAVLENFAPPVSVLSLPYVFRDEEHRFAVLGGEVGRELLEASVPYRLRGLTYYDAGARSFYTVDRPVRTPGDLAGMKIRVQESQTAIEMVRALGGNPTPISWGELYTSLQQGVVDGAENNPPSFFLSRHYEVARYFTIDEHTAVPDVLMMSEPIYAALTEQQQAWLVQAARESATYQRVLWREATEEALDAVTADGVEVLYVDKAPFQNRVQAMLARAGSDPEVGALLERIAAVQSPVSLTAPADDERGQDAEVQP